jgi:hypothetical protein
LDFDVLGFLNYQVKEDEMNMACSMGENRNAYWVSVGKPEGK